MALKVIWSPLAENDLEIVLYFLQEIWNEHVVNEFINEIEKTINQISINSKLFPVINKKKKVRKCVLTRHNTIFYREKNGSIEIIRLFDSRQDPKKLKY